MATINQRAELAASPGTSSDVLRSLAADAHWRVRYAVAANHSCPPDILRVLAQDDQVVVRLGIADNPQTLALTIALNSPDHETRQRVIHLRFPRNREGFRLGRCR
jgi:hypothetical protein